MVQNKRILITGGAGFIGTHMANRLAADNKVTLLDIDTETNAFSYSPLVGHKNVRLVKGDVRDAKVVEQEVAQCDILLHFASLIGVKKVIENARDTINTIIFGTHNVLEAARKNPKIERLVYISTSEVYGNVLSAEEGTDAPISTANDPRTCYASAKVMGEHQVWAYRRDFNLPTVTVRPFNIFGPWRKASHAIGLFVVKALAEKDITLYGDGSQLRSWCYVDDFCDGIMGCIERSEAVGEDFNLGNPLMALTIYDLALRITHLVGSSSKITTTDHIFREIGVRSPSCAKAKKHLGYTAKFDLETALKPTIAWYKAHLNDFRDWM